MTPLPLLPPLIPGGNPILLLDNSTLDLYNNCPREGLYGHIENHVSTDEKPALNFGAAAHEGWKARYIISANKAVSPVTQGIQNEIIIEHFNQAPQPNDNFRSPSLCLELMARYNECYGDEPWTIVSNPKTGKPAVEQSVMVFLGTIYYRDRDAEVDPNDENYAEVHRPLDLYYTGRIDLVISWLSGTWILDHKTTFQFGKQFEATMSMTAQFLGYAWAWQQMTGVLPTGYIVNAVRVRKPTAASLLAEDFFRVRGSDTDFCRLPFYITQANIDEWKDNTLALARTILYHHSQGVFPMNRSACVRKYGSCQFYEVCNADSRVRGEILKSQAFQQNQWSPLNKLIETQITKTNTTTN